jgi:predicted ATPase
MFHQFCREEVLARERAEAVIAVSTQYGFTQWMTAGSIPRGWARALQGEGEEETADMRHGLATLQTMGLGLNRPYYLTLLAEAYGEIGQPEEGLAVLSEAVTLVDKTGERFWEAELYRLKGELTLQQENQKSKIETNLQEGVVWEAEGYLLKAVEIARKQQAKSLELRASTSLARLWQQQGKNAEAYKLLSDVYNWFTEGFDTKDLREAKALLEELSP